VHGTALGAVPRLPRAQEIPMNKHFITYMTVVAVAMSAHGVSAQSSSTAAATHSAADNTGNNKRDRAAGEPTADQQKNNARDLDMTKRIRRSVTDDKAISTYGHNVKIIASGGMVTLKGPVRDEGEKKAIEMKATEIAGKDHVINQLEVAPPK
jgi:hyperosmotically inducible periplasmic protein